MQIDKSLFFFHVRPKFLFWARLLMLTITAYFIWDIFQSFDRGYVRRFGFEYSTYATNFYAHIALDLLKVAAFGWYGTLGLKKTNPDNRGGSL